MARVDQSFQSASVNTCESGLPSIDCTAATDESTTKRRTEPTLAADSSAVLVPSSAGLRILFSASVLSITSTMATVCTTPSTPANASS